MEKLLVGLVGKSVDIGCGTSAIFRGEVVEAADGVVRIKDEDGKITFIAIEKISSVCERSDSHSRPGFIG
jgi:hypothetical protein